MATQAWRSSSAGPALEQTSQGEVKMASRTITTMAVAAVALAVNGGAVLAQGTGNNAPMPPVPHHKVTPSHMMQHPRSVPEPSVTDQLNAMSLSAAQKGQVFSPPPPGQDYNAQGSKM